MVRWRDRVDGLWPAARVRRPYDVVQLALAGTLLTILLVLTALLPGTEEPGLPMGLRGLPRGLVSVANVIASLAVLIALITVLVDAVRRRFAATTAVLATIAGAVTAVLLQQAGSLGWFATLGPKDGSAVVPLAAAVALLVGADPSRGRRSVPVAVVAISASVICSLLLGSVTVIGAVAVALVGLTVGFAVRVAVGVIPARPAEKVLRAVLGQAGFAVDTLEVAAEVTGRVQYTTKDTGVELRVTVVDPDRGGVTLFRRMGRVLRYRVRAIGRPALSLRGALERQALASALAGRAGVPVAEVLALLAADTALVLVERPLQGEPLPTEDDGTVLSTAFRALRRLHDMGLAHGAIDAACVITCADGTVGFDDLRLAQPAASHLQRDLDVIGLLASTARMFGAARAVDALRRGYGPAPRTDRLVPLLQPLALGAPVRRAVSGSPVLDELRQALTGPHDAGDVAPEPQLTRVRVRTVITLTGAVVAAYLLAQQLSDVPLGTVLQRARPGWLGVAVGWSAVTYLGPALVLVAFAPHRLPLWRSTLVQVAASFVTVVTPPTVGHIGLNVRYLQRSGLAIPVAAAAVGVGQVVTVVVTVILLLAAGWLSGLSFERPSLLPSGGVVAVLLGAAALLALAAALPASRRFLRRQLEPLVRTALPQLIQASTQPRRLAVAALGVLILNAGNVLALDAALRAFGTSLDLPTLAVVFLVASTVGSVAPVPGGLGAVEAALVAGLSTAGVPVAATLPAVLAFRTATLWLPAPVGWLTLLRLQHRHVI